MPIVTRTVALGIPPKVHELKPKKGTKSKSSTRKTKALKQVSKSESELEELVSVTKKKTKRQRVDSPDLEVVGEDVEAQEEIEEADAGC